MICCPICNKHYEIESASFGISSLCPCCGKYFIPDTSNIVHYQFPKTLKICVEPLFFEHIVIIKKGFTFPLMSTKNGVLLISKEEYDELEYGKMSEDIMSKNDFSLNRYIQIEIPQKESLIDIINKRVLSKWSLTKNEEMIYGNKWENINWLKQLNADIVNTKNYRIDLENGQNEIVVNL
jgi:hypothetical protein